MCIRDRHRALDKLKITPELLLIDGNRFKLYKHIKHECIICLLYTSDAADERSSVDLGGRRIIKKKKHQKTDRERSIKQTKKRENQTQHQEE